MPADITTLAESLASHMAAVVAGATIERRYLPFQKLEEYATGTKYIWVVAKSRSQEPYSRSEREAELTVDVAFECKVASTANATLDPLIDVANQIADSITNDTIADFKWIRTEQPLIYAQDRLTEHRLFTSVISFTFTSYHDD